VQQICRKARDVLEERKVQNNCLHLEADEIECESLLITIVDDKSGIVMLYRSVVWFQKLQNVMHQ